MTVIDRPWLFRDDDGSPRFRTSWHEETRAPEPRWPGPRPKKAWQPYDAGTERLMQTYSEMYRLQESNVVVPLLEDWKWRDRMNTAAEKQRYLEPLLEQVKRAPERNAGTMIFLLLVCEPIRRAAANRLVSARWGLEGPTAAPAAHRREETRRLDEIERDRLHEVTRLAVMEALYRYPSPAPSHFFGWLRETVAHRALDFLREELSELQTKLYCREEAEAMQQFLAGFDGLEPPALGEEGGFRRWHFGVRSLWEPTQRYLRLREVRSICRTAVERLPQRQRAVIDAEFYDGMRPAEIAEQHGIARSTVYNHKAQALKNLYDDDCFFMALYTMEIVRGAARRDKLMEKYPDGRLPDGRRIVHIEAA
jgi:RNA polymerase sigma factor (sigma-70 family)